MVFLYGFDIDAVSNSGYNLVYGKRTDGILIY